MYGDHILRTLMARSPKLGHTVRRYSGSLSSSGGRPRANSGGRGRRTAARISSSGMLLPPFAPGQYMRPQFQGTSVPPPFFGVLPGAEQFSPPHHLSVSQQGVVVTVPSPPSPGDVAFGVPPSTPRMLFIQPPPTSSSIPASPLSLPSSSRANLVVIDTGDPPARQPWSSQDTQLPGPQDNFPLEVPVAAPTGGHLLPALAQPLIRKDVICKHFIAGQCPFAEKCWFGHPENSTQLVQANDITNSSIPSLPLHGPPLPSNVSHGGTSPSYNTVQNGPTPPTTNPSCGPMQSSGVDPALQWSSVEGLWPHLMPGVYRGPRPAVFPSGLSSGQPFLFFRPPLPGAHIPSPVPFIPPTLCTPSTPLPDVALTFALLSEVVVRGTQGDVINELSNLAVFADHFYLSFGTTVQAYKVLFGGNRSYQDTSVVQEHCILKRKVTCLHCSRPMPSLLVIGTEAGGVYTWDMKRGPRILTALHEPEEIGCAVTALTHFMTSINMAQVVVAGGARGTLTWYISQPPQKTFSILFTDSQHCPVSIVSLQILGGMLLSGGRDGRIFLWNMSSHQPQLNSVLAIQCAILKDIHILHGNSFLTLGIAPAGTEPVSSLCHQSSQEGGAPCTDGLVKPTNGHQINAVITVQSSNNHYQVEALADNVSNLNIHSSDGGKGEGVPKWCASLWENEHPPKCTRTVYLGPVVSNAFYHHPNVGNMFLSVGMEDGRVKIYNVPSFNVACDLKFAALNGKECVQLALNLSREQPPVPTRSPFKDLLLTTVWSDGKVMICQAQKQ